MKRGFVKFKILKKTIKKLAKLCITRLVKLALRWSSPPDMARFLLPSLLEGDALAQVRQSLGIMELCRAPWAEWRCNNYTWQILLPEDFRSDHKVLLVGQDPGMDSIEKELRQLGCTNLTRTPLARLQDTLSLPIGEEQHYHFFSRGIDWCENSFPPSQHYNWIIVGPEIARLYHRPHFLNWLKKRYHCTRFLVRLPAFSNDLQQKLSRSLEMSTSIVYRVLYNQESAQLEFGMDFQLELKGQAEVLGELHYQLRPQAQQEVSTEQPLLVSLIIPVYNTEAYLRDCLDSAIQQSLSHIEIIIVNDASPDNSADIIAEYSQRDPRITVIVNENNLGVSESRNRAIEIARGDYLFFLDSDDYLHPEALRTTYYLAQASGCDIVKHAFIDQPQPSPPHIGCYLVRRDKQEVIFPHDSPYLLPFIWHLLRRETLEHYRLRFPQGRLIAEDLMLTFQLTCQPIQFLLAPISLLYFRPRRGSCTRSHLSFKHIDDFTWVMQEIQRLLAERNLLSNQRGFYRYVRSLARHWHGWLNSDMLREVNLQRQFAMLHHFWEAHVPLFQLDSPLPEAKELAAIVNVCVPRENYPQIWQLLGDVEVQLKQLLQRERRSSLTGPWQPYLGKTSQ